MRFLPHNNNIPTQKLSSVFNDVTNSYKFFWFLAILGELKDNKNAEIPLQNLYDRMLSEVWYPLDYYKLSFGKQDSFITIIKEVNSKINIDNGINSESPALQIRKKLDAKYANDLKQKMGVLIRWVPFRFMRPFFINETKGLPDQKVNSTIINLAKTSFVKGNNKCPYYILADRIVLNNYWKRYFQENIYILQSFTYWHIVRYLQRNNPNVIGISEKIFKPFNRNLKLNSESWKLYLLNNPDTKCIYSGETIPDKFTMDHFIPWSYIVNDLNWNIIPTSKEINSKKSDNLPFLPKYLEKFTELQYDFFYTISSQSKFEKIIEQYILLFNLDIKGILQIPKRNFKKKIEETIIPMGQIAKNMGFLNDWKL